MSRFVPGSRSCWSLIIWQRRSTRMLITGIKSKPVYAPLQPDLRGRYHLMVGHGVGGEPLLRVLRDLQAAAPSTGACTRILYVTDAAASDSIVGQIRSANVADVRLFERGDELL